MVSATRRSPESSHDAAEDVAALREATLDAWLAVASQRSEDGDTSYQALEAELHALRSSFSWRVTAPVRALRKWLR